MNSVNMVNWETIRADQFCAFITDGTHDSPDYIKYGLVRCIILIEGVFIMPTLEKISQLNMIITIEKMELRLIF